LSNHVDIGDVTQDYSKKNKKGYICLKQSVDKPDVMMPPQVVVRRRHFSADE